MTIDSVTTLIETLRHERLLDAEQFNELTPVLGNFDNPQTLARHLVQANWLTVYQVRHLFEGYGTRLVVGSYCIVDRLGEGGVSEVYKAWDGPRSRHVALKVMRQDLVSDEHAVRQFERELQAVTRLSHPNIVKTHDAGRTGTSHYFAMEFIEGTDLGKVVHLSGALGIAEACDYVRQVASGLQYAHTMGLVHRDIKPANLYLIHPPGHDAPTPGITWKRPADPVIKILDWGLARLQQPTSERNPSEPCATKQEEGMLIGTADYIAPEQARDPHLVDIRADIYSLGCTFYYLLTGQPPFAGNSLMQKLMQHQQSEPRPLRELRPDVPEELAGIVMKMLAKQPEARYQIPLAVAVPLRRFCGEHGTTSSNGLNRRPGNCANGSALRPSAQGTEDRPPVGSSQGFLRRKQ
jgi:serine/threonine-protein kinase